MAFFSWLGKSNNNQKKTDTLRSLNTSREGLDPWAILSDSFGKPGADCLLATQGKRREMLRLLSTRIPFCAAQGSIIASNASITPFHGMRLLRSGKKERKPLGARENRVYTFGVGVSCFPDPKWWISFRFALKPETTGTWYPQKKRTPRRCYLLWKWSHWLPFI